MDNRLVNRNNPDRFNKVMVPERIKKKTEAGSNRTLTFLIGMGGYGKTSCITSHVKDLQARPNWVISWLTVTPLDNVFVRFWSWIIQAVCQDDESLNLSDDFIKDIDTTSFSESYLWVIDFLGLIGHQEKEYYIAIDDVHHLDDSEILELLNYVFLNAPSNLHFALMGRSNPGISLYKLRTMDRLIELGVDDLAFTYAETASFFGKKQLRSVSTEDIEKIYGITKGWVAGLHMIELLLKNEKYPRKLIESFPKDNKWLMNFLTEEVLHAMDFETKDFLLRTSFLPYATQDTYECVTHSANCSKMITSLLDMNLLMKVSMGNHESSETVWYSYHPLFSESLQHCMEMSYTKTEIAEMHEIAYVWYESAGLYDHAIRIAMEAGDFEEALCFITKHLYSVLSTVESNVLLHWLESLPHPQQHNEYLYALINAWANFIAGKTKRSRMWLDQANTMKIKNEGSDVLKGTNRIHETIEIGTLVFAGENERALELGRKSLENLGGPQLFLRGTIMHNMGEAFERLGKFEEAYEYFTRAKVSADRSGRQAVSLLCSNELGWIQYVRGNLESASNIYLKTVASCKESHCEDSWALGLLYAGLARLYFHWGDNDKTAYYLDQASLRLSRQVNKDAFLEAQVIIAELQIRLGFLDDAKDTMLAAYELLETDQAPRGINLLVPMGLTKVLTYASQYTRACEILTQVKNDINAEDAYYQVLWSIGYSCLQLKIGNYKEALQFAEEALVVSRKAGLLLLAQEAGVFIACAQKGIKNNKLARMAIVEVLTNAAWERHAQIFLADVPYLHALLYEVVYAQNENKVLSNETRTAKDFASVLLSMRMETDEKRGEDPMGLEKIKDLSDREVEIYELLKEGKTRKEIAECLGIRLNTVRTHVRNIYKKIEVNDRSLL